MLTHIFFSGGNIWGFTYLGVIRYLYTYPDTIKHVKDIGGTSVGSVFALMFALKIPIKKMEDLIYKYAKDDELKCNSSKNIINIIHNNGMESASKYMKYIIEYIESKYKKNYKEFTFLELSKISGINLHVNALCINKSEDTLFNVNLTPNVSIIDAVTASISLPVNNNPHVIDGYLYCDPFFINNTVASFFTHVPQKQILSILSCNKNHVEEIPKNTELDTLTYHTRLLHIVRERLNIFSHQIHKNEDCLIIDEHDNIVSIDINQNGIFHVIDEKSIDNCIIHGFNKTMKWFTR